MKWADLLRLACRNLAHTGIRAWLCLLAVCIGMTSVSTVFSVGAAAQQGIAQEIDRIGISGLAFYSKQPFELQQELLEAVKSVQTVSAAMPMSLLSGDVRLRNRRSSAGILGIDAALGQIFHLEVLYGALPSQAQVANREKIAVIDAELARSVYHRENIVGKQIYLTVSDITDAFTICAVISSQSANLSAVLGSVLPCVVYVPYTALEGMTSAAAPDKITVAVDGEDVAQTAAQIQQVLQPAPDQHFIFIRKSQSIFVKLYKNHRRSYGAGQWHRGDLHGGRGDRRHEYDGRIGRRPYAGDRDLPGAGSAQAGHFIAVSDGIGDPVRCRRALRNGREPAAAGADRRRDEAHGGEPAVRLRRQLWLRRGLRRFVRDPAGIPCGKAGSDPGHPPQPINSPEESDHKNRTAKTAGRGSVKRE